MTLTQRELKCQCELKKVTRQMVYFSHAFWSLCEMAFAEKRGYNLSSLKSVNGILYWFFSVGSSIHLLSLHFVGI